MAQQRPAQTVNEYDTRVEQLRTTLTQRHDALWQLRDSVTPPFNTRIANATLTAMIETLEQTLDELHKTFDYIPD